MSVRDLRAVYRGREEVVAVDGICFDLCPGESLGLVGESGCGKSTVALSILKLLRPPGSVTGGEVRFGGVDLLRLEEDELRHVRGRDIAVVFQDPTASLNPLVRVATQIIEAQLAHRDVGREEAFERAVTLLQAVGIPNARGRMHDYPHQLSGGMKQRLAIAIALSCEPRVLIADEPTTALDATIQAQVLELLRSERAARDLSMLVVSHDLGVVARLTDRVAILYAGRIVEEGPTRAVLTRPRHPYTRLLLRARPCIDEPRRARFAAIPGSPPIGASSSPGCAFAARCPSADTRCREKTPPRSEEGGGHSAVCWQPGTAGVA